MTSMLIDNTRCHYGKPLNSDPWVRKQKRSEIRRAIFFQSRKLIAQNNFGSKKENWGFN